MKVTLPVFLHAQENPYDTDGSQPYKFSLWGISMASAGYIPLGKLEVEFDAPSTEQIVAGHTVLLRTKIKEVQAEADKQVGELREQLARLEALTYTPREPS